MVQRACRLWNISVAILAILTIYNILLTIRLMYIPECSRNTINVQTVQEIPRQPCQTVIQYTSSFPFPNLHLQNGRWDNTRSYKFFDNFVVGDQFAYVSNRSLVCLATQSSVEKLHSLAQVANHWSGPISAAVFAAGEEEFDVLLTYITYLRQCVTGVMERVSFHLVLPKDKMPADVKADLTNLDSFDCLKPEETLNQLLKRLPPAIVKWRSKNPYPQNHLRNVARKNCQNSYVFLTDVDIVPSYNLSVGLERFLRNEECKTKCAYVVPTYELDERVHFPPNKSELMRLARKGLARPFHEKVFIFNQFATNFSRWQSETSESNEIHISHPVTNFEFLYEPFYVAPDTAPPHDERFLGYGYTRNTQVYEMYVAGYEFFVLSPAFTCHWGLQIKRGRPTWREQQNTKNRKKFDTFKNEIFARYQSDPLNLMKKKS